MSLANFLSCGFLILFISKEIVDLLIYFVEIEVISIIKNNNMIENNINTEEKILFFFIMFINIQFLYFQLF